MTYFFTLNQYGKSDKLTPSQAITILLPSQSGNSGKVLSTNGSSLQWITGGGGGLTGSGTANEIAYFTGTTVLGSLTIATYPSLTELSYVKGVTSAIQTQLNSKGSGTVTSVAALTLGTAGTDLSSSVATSTTTPVITLNVPTASASNRGALSSTDWSTFNNKIGGSGTTNEIAYFSGSSTLSSLSTATYPTLTELSYVKGVTSAIQTQISNIANTIPFGKFGTINASTTEYISITGLITPGTVTNRATPMPRSGSISKLYFYTENSQVVSGSLQVTIYKNGVATALTATQPAGSAAGVYSNTSDSFTFVAGDLIVCQLKNNASTGSNIRGVSIMET